MRITEKAIKAIRESAECRRELMYQLEVSQTTMYRWIDENDMDGKLTTARALSIISETTGLTQDEILETENVA